jgi:hypothetical protein
LIDVLLSVRPTPTIGAPPTDTPGEPNAPLLPPVVCTPPMLFVVLVPAAPFVVAPPVPVEEPNPLLELELVPPIGDVEEPLLPKPDPELPPNGEVDDPAPKPEPDDDPLPNPDPEEPSDELPLPSEVPGDPPEEPKADDDPNPPLVPLPVLVLAPVGVMPFCCTVCPNKPIAGTFCSPL